MTTIRKTVTIENTTNLHLLVSSLAIILSHHETEKQAKDALHKCEVETPNREAVIVAPGASATLTFDEVVQGVHEVVDPQVDEFYQQAFGVSLTDIPE